MIIQTITNKDYSDDNTYLQTIVFQLPNTRDLYMTNPLHLMGFLLRDRCEGSLFAMLQDKGKFVFDVFFLVLPPAP